MHHRPPQRSVRERIITAQVTRLEQRHQALYAQNGRITRAKDTDHLGTSRRGKRNGV